MLRAMTEQPPPPPVPVSAEGQPRGALSGTDQPVERPLLPGNPRRAMAVWGGGLAGLGLGIMAACLLRVIEQANPSGFYGPGIGGTVALVVLVAGPAIGFGFGTLAAGLIPDARSLPPQLPATRPTGPASGS